MKKLKPEPKHGYSKSETIAIKTLLSRRKPIDTLELVERVYKDRDAPFNAQKSVIGLMRGLKRKIEANQESFALVQSERNGPHAASFWLEDAVEV